MDTTIKGKNEASDFRYTFSDRQGGVKYATLTFSLAHTVLVKPIPGKGHKDITIRTTDVKAAGTGTLWTCTMDINCIYEDQFNRIKDMVELGGPFEIICAFGKYTMYITTATFSQEPGFNEPGSSMEGSDRVAFYCHWNINFIEKGN